MNVPLHPAVRIYRGISGVVSSPDANYIHAFAGTFWRLGNMLWILVDRNGIVSCYAPSAITQK